MVLLKPASGGLRINGRQAGRSLEQPLVTVITAVFNGKDCIAECIESVLSQDYPNIEHIIIDGNSDDGTYEILRRYEDRIAYWLSEPDSGVYEAWNKGLDLALGEWISFLGADDIYLPGAISAYMDRARESPSARYLSSRIQLDYSSGRSSIRGEPWAWPRFAGFMCSAHPGSMHSRNLFAQYGRFDTSYRIVGDYELLLRPRDGLVADFIPAITVRMKAGGLSASTKALREAMRAKIQTGARSSGLAKWEFQIAAGKYHLKNILSRSGLSY